MKGLRKVPKLVQNDPLCYARNIFRLMTTNTSFNSAVALYIQHKWAVIFDHFFQWIPFKYGQTKFKISQRLIKKKYIYKIEMDEKLIFEKVNFVPKSVQNATLYLSDPWYKELGESEGRLHFLKIYQWI